MFCSWKLQPTHKTTFRKYLTLGGSILTVGAKKKKMGSDKRMTSRLGPVEEF